MKKYVKIAMGMIFMSLVAIMPAYASASASNNIDTNNVYYVKEKSGMSSELGYLIMMPTQARQEGNAIYVSYIDNDEDGGNDSYSGSESHAKQQAKKEATRIAKDTKLQQYVLDKLNDYDKSKDDEQLYNSLKKKGLKKSISLKHYVVSEDNQALDLYYPYYMENRSINVYDVVQGKPNKHGIINFNSDDNNDQSKPTDEDQADQILADTDPNKGNSTGNEELDDLSDQVDDDMSTLRAYGSGLSSFKISLKPTKIKVVHDN